MRRVLALALALGLLAAPAAAATSESAAAFLRYGSGARALALGKAMVALADDADAVYWNPAGIVRLKERQLSYHYSRPLGDVDGLNYHTFAFAAPNEGNGYGFDAVYFDAGEIPGYDLNGVATGNFSASSYAIHLAYAGTINNQTSWGVTTKYIHESIAGSGGGGVGADLGMLYRPAPEWSLGILLQDVVGAELKLANTGYRVPLRVWLGGAWRPNPQFAISVSADKTKYTDLAPHVGLEYSPVPPLALRAGYTGDTKEYSAGIGFVSGEYRLDYSYANSTDLGDSHRVGFRMSY